MSYVHYDYGHAEVNRMKKTRMQRWYISTNQAASNTVEGIARAAAKENDVIARSLLKRTRVSADYAYTTSHKAALSIYGSIPPMPTAAAQG